MKATPIANIAPVRLRQDQYNDTATILTALVGMYSRQTWGGPVDPFILVKFLNSTIPEGADPIVSLIIFQWRDKNLVGIPDPNNRGRVRAALLHPQEYSASFE
jgi:hypothetical protein